jgi:hypothetical protein
MQDRHASTGMTGTDHADILPRMDNEPEDPHGELERARRDPRLKHGREAVIADWRAAMESAERVRRLADWGLHVLQDAESLERVRLASSPTDPEYAERALSAARRRAAMAAAEANNEMVELNAMTLVAMVSATDAFVEGLVPQAHQMLIEVQVNRMMDKAAKDHTQAAADIGGGQLAHVRALLIDALAEKLRDVDGTPRGSGAKRWDEPLARIGLGSAAPKRAIPVDMDAALAEVIQLRHVVAHRAGRVDARALKAAPSLAYAEGELVRIDRAGYKRYSAALWTYGEEILHRMGMGPSALDHWTMNYTINA